MLLIDTYNVLHATGVLPPDLAGLDTPALAELIAHSRYADRAVKLVCDGARTAATRSPRTPGIEFLFAGPGHEADELIERIIAANSAPRRLLVVSSDRRITTAARRRRAATLSSESFLAHLASDRTRPRRAALPAFTQDIPLDAYSVAHWMQEFGLEPGDIDELKKHLAGRAAKAGAKPASAPPTVGSEPAAKSPRTDAPAQTAPVDPVLLAALQEWPGRVGLDDLDMRKWLGELHQPRSERPLPPRGRGRRAGG